MAHRSLSFDEAEHWGLASQERLSALVAIRADVEWLMTTSGEISGLKD